jgi:hypothetical protein
LAASARGSILRGAEVRFLKTYQQGMADPARGHADNIWQ